MTIIHNELEQQICHKEHETVLSKIIKMIKSILKKQ